MLIGIDAHPRGVGRQGQAETEASPGWRHQHHIAGADDNRFCIELIQVKFAVRVARQGVQRGRAYLEEDIQERIEVVPLVENAVELTVCAVGDFL